MTDSPDTFDAPDVGEVAASDKWETVADLAAAWADKTVLEAADVQRSDL